MSNTKKWFINSGSGIWFTEDGCHASEAHIESLGYKKVGGAWCHPDGTSCVATAAVEESCRKAVAGNAARTEIHESTRQGVTPANNEITEALKQHYVGLGMTEHDAAVAVGLGTEVTDADWKNIGEQF